MADAILGSVSIPIPIGYILEPVKLESSERSLDGTLLVNYAVNNEDTAIDKYHFELQGITRSLRLAVRAEAKKTGNLTYTDHIQIPEVFSYDGTTGTLSLQRALGTTSANDISVIHGDTTQTVTITSGSPAAGNVYINSTGQMWFGTSSGGTNNILVYYPPKYNVHIVSERHELMFKTSTTDHTVRYNLVLEEV